MYFALEPSQSAGMRVKAPEQQLLLRREMRTRSIGDYRNVDVGDSKQRVLPARVGETSEDTKFAVLCLVKM